MNKENRFHFTMSKTIISNPKSHYPHLYQNWINWTELCLFDYEPKSLLYTFYIEKNEPTRINNKLKTQLSERMQQRQKPSRHFIVSDKILEVLLYLLDFIVYFLRSFF